MVTRIGHNSVGWVVQHNGRGVYGATTYMRANDVYRKLRTYLRAGMSDAEAIQKAQEVK